MPDRRWLVAIIAAGAFLGGAIAGRVSAPTPSGPDGATASDAGTAPATEPSVRTDGDSDRIQDRSPEGAARAASRYAVLLDGPLLLDRDERVSAVEATAAEGAAPALERSLGQVADLIASRLGLEAEQASDPGFVWRAVPAGWQVRSYDGLGATVAIWGTGVIVFEGRQLDQPGWRTTEVDLRWEGGEWRLVAFRSEAGPTPPGAGDPSAAAIGRTINEFRPFVPGVPEGGGQR